MGAFPKPAHPDSDGHFLYQPGFFFSFVAKGPPCGHCRGSHGLGLLAPVFTLGAGPDLRPLGLPPSAPVSRLTSPWLAASVSLLVSASLSVSPPRGRGGSRTSSGSFRERWARVPAQLQPLREEQGEPLTGGHAQPPSDMGAPACSGPSPSRLGFPCSVSPSQSSGRTKARVQDSERWDQPLSSSPAEPTEPSAPSGSFLLVTPQNFWASPFECRALGGDPQEAAVNNTPQGVPSAAVSPWLIQGLPWTERSKVRAVMGHPGDCPWDHL